MAKFILDKFNKIVSKNKEWRNIKQINKILIGETINNDNLKNCNFNLDNYLCMKCVLTTSVDVERSFPIYKHILRSNCQCFSEDNLSKYMVINFFF